MKFMLLAALIPLLAAAPAALAEVKLPSIFGDNMVLQRDMKAPVWGTAEPGERITIIIAGQQKVAEAGKDGKWMVRLDPLKAGGPHEMVVKGKGNTVTLKNVMAGEVWFCSGQSNMAFGLKSAASAAEAIPAANHPNVRLCSWGGEWKVCTPKSAEAFSAIGYFFGRDLHKALGVPVGVICRGIGGTPAEAWTSEETFRTHPYLKKVVLEPWQKNLAEYPEKFEAWKAAPADKKPPRPIGPDYASAPGALFAQHVAPIIPYGIRGTLWYQGESNAWGFPIADQYYKMLPALIRDWRRNWGQGDFPFLVVQLPNYPANETPRPLEPSPWQLVQDAQAKATQMPNVGVVITIDMGEANIHPKIKAPVGARIALLARAMVHGHKIVHSGPTFERMTREGDKVRLHFTNIGGGLVAHGGALKGFALAGEDRCFFWADAKIDGGAVLVSCDEVKQPAAVRYAFAEATPSTLYNKEGLPAGPFRTDDWSWEVPVEKARAARCVRAKRPPKVDGKLDDEAWKKCPALADFTVAYSYRPSAHPTEARLCYDDANLYVAFRCAEPDANRLAAKVQGRDDKNIWSDDYVELMLDANRDRKTYFRFAFNAKAALTDGNALNDAADGVKWLNQGLLGGDRDFDVAWNLEDGAAAAGTQQGAWTLEASIPWKALGVAAPKRGDAMGLLLTRGHADPKEDSEWTVTGRDRNTGAMLPSHYLGGCTMYHSPLRFGALKFE